MKLFGKSGRVCVLLAIFCLTAGMLIGCAEKEDDGISSGSTIGGGVDTP